MPTKTYTETTCQGCGKVVKREGECSGPPASWMQGQLYIYDGAGTTKQHIWVDALCVACGDAVLKVLGVKRKRQRREPALDRLAKELEVPAPQPLGAVTYQEPARDVGTGANDLSRRYASLNALGKELGDLARPETITIPCPHSIETPHIHHEHGDEVVCVEPDGGWPANDKA